MCFFQIGNCKKVDAQLFQFAGDVPVAMPIGVCFDDGDDAGLRRDSRADGFNIMLEGVEIDFCPGPF